MVERDHPALSLSRQCRLLSIGRSSLYYAAKGESAETLALMRRIDELFLKYPFYGARQMVRHLRREGVCIGRGRAGRLMRLMGLQAIYRAPRTSDPQGAITDDDFEFDGETYELDAVVLTGDTGLGNFSAEQAIACFGDNEPSEAVRNRLGLRIGAHSFKLADASAVSGLVCFEWARPSGLAWAWGDIALVKMTEVGPNSAATGAPAITGTANVGATLTAAIGTIADTDGLPGTFPDDYGFQWVRVDSDGTSNPADISGATASTYTLVAADQGKKIKVKASFTDDAGNAEELTGAAWPASGTVGAPRIVIEPERAKVTGRFDFIHYTLTRRGPTTDALTVTVTLEPPAGNDWGIDDDKIDHQVTFGAGEATARLSINTSPGLASIGFSNSATMGGTLGASLGDVAGYDTTDTAAVVIVLVANPLWVVRMPQPHYSFAEGAGAQTVEVEVAAVSADMPPPASRPNGIHNFEVSFSTDAGTATSASGDYAAVSLFIAVPTSAFSAGADGIQRARVSATFTPTQDSAVEGDETLSFVLERAPIVQVGKVTMEGPDGTRSTIIASYPVTLLDDDAGVVGVAVVSTPGAATDTSSPRPGPRRTQLCYGLSERIRFGVTFSVPVDVTGSPHFEFSLGASGSEATKEAAFVSGSGTTELVFAYAVQAADTDTDGIAVGDHTTTIKLDTGEHIRNAGADAALDHDAPGTLSGHKVDGSQAGGANTAATGAPTISGINRVGRTLTADTSGIDDADGLTNVSYEYRWIRVAGTTETEVGTDAATYTPVAADAGAGIKVEVSFTDDRGFAEALESAPVAVRAAMPPATCPAFSAPPGRERIWTGTLTVGALQFFGTTFGHGYQGSAGSLSDTDFDIGSNSYTVARTSVSVVSGLEGALEFNLDSALTPGQRRNLRLHVCGETYAFADASFDSADNTYGWPDAGLDWSGLVGMTRQLQLTVKNAAPTGLPVVTGTARVGRTLTASTAGIRDADGLTNVAYEYQWIREDTDGSNREEISGATSQTYELAGDDAGKRVKVEVSFTDDAGNGHELTSAAFPRTGAIAPALAPMLESGDLLSATLTASVQSSGSVGCGTSTVSSCEDTSVLTDNDFEIGATTYTITVLTEQNGAIILSLDAALPDAEGGVLSLEVTEDSTTSTLKLSDGTTEFANRYSWSSTGQSWSDDDSVTVKVISDPPDTTPPAFDPDNLFGGVTGTGTQISLYFDENLDSSNPPGAGAFAVTADGSAVTVTTVFVAGKSSLLTVSPAIPQGQTVIVTYTDPTAGDDAEALQDAAGNDVATFSATVQNYSTVDVIPPVLQSAYTSTNGAIVFLSFDENLESDPASRPPASAFEVTAGGAAVTIGSTQIYSSSREVVQLLNLSPVIRQGQTVVVTYTDPSSADDTAAIQDLAGNDAASFTTGESGVPAVTNESTVAPTAPGAPENPAAEAGGDTSIVVTWDPPADNGGRAIASYRIEYSEDVDPLVWQELVAAHAPMENGRIVTRYEHPGLEPATTRHYRVRAKNAVGDGAWSASVEAETTSGAPGAPTDLTANGTEVSGVTGPTQIILGWQRPTDTGDSAITGYRVEYSENVTPLVWQVLDPMSQNTGAVDLRLPSETVRHYRVFAINDDGRSLPSDVVIGRTPDVAGPVPVSATVWENGLAVTVAFDEVLERELAKLPERGAIALAADGDAIVVGQISVARTTPDPEYKYLVLSALSRSIKQGQTVTIAYTDPSSGDDGRAIQDDDGNDAASFATGAGGVAAVTNGSTVAVTAPGAPTGLDAEGAGGDRIVVRWSAPADTGGRAITGYVLEVSTDGATFPASERVDITATDPNTGRIATAYAHTGLGTGDTRHYRVAARNGPNAADLGPATAIVNAVTVHPEAPDAPENLNAAPGVPAPPDGTTQVTLTWSRPADRGGSAISGYRIEVSEDVDPLQWRDLVANTGSTARRHVDGDLPSEVTRHYRVSAINDQGMGLPSDAVSAETPDIVAPAPVSASVPAAGTSVAITFDEALDDTASRLPQAARFAVTTAAGDEIRLDGVAVSGTTVTLSLHADSPVIRTGQTVTVAYTDRTSGDDAGGVVQDDAGNDAASFATGAGGVAAVVNGSTVAVGNPGAPRNLAARPAGADSIRVTWDPPADTGGRAITFYWLQASTDGTTFADLAEIDATDPNTGRVATEYTHTGLQIGDARHYRVRAHNDALALSPYSGVVMGRALEPEGRVDVAFDPAGVSEGGTATVLVTATTVVNAQPASGFELTVALATEDGTATAPGDYAALDETVRFGRGDFSRRTVDGASRWVAEKRATVTIVDDVEAENAETFAATARVTNIETSRFVAETGRAEATIAASDPWAVSVTAAPSSVTEGESVSVALTARIVRGDGTAPGSGECLVPFAVDVGLAVSGTATGDGAGYTLSGTTAAQEIAACSTAGVSWTVELAALVDAEDDGGETVAFAPEIAGTPAVAPAEGTAGTVFLRELKSVLLDRIALGVDEGGSAGYTARLTSRPTGTVTLTPQVSGDMDVTVAPSVLTFTGSNWNLPQTLTVHAAQDADDEDDTASVRPSAWPTRAGSMPARSAGSTAGTIAPTKPRQVSMPASCTGLTCSTGRDPVPGRLAAEWHPDGPVRARVRRLARRAATPGRKACE